MQQCQNFLKLFFFHKLKKFFQFAFQDFHSHIIFYYWWYLILHQNYDLNLDEKYNIEGIHLSYEIFKSLNKNIREKLIKKYKRIGVSIHSLEEAKDVENLGATYVVAGHIFETDCKKGLEPRGLNFIKELSSILTIPIFAIGGINEENSNLVLNSGAFGVCMMSSLMKY